MFYNNRQTTNNKLSSIAVHSIENNQVVNISSYNTLLKEKKSLEYHLYEYLEKLAFKAVGDKYNIDPIDLDMFTEYYSYPLLDKDFQCELIYTNKYMTVYYVIKLNGDLSEWKNSIEINQYDDYELYELANEDKLKSDLSEWCEAYEEEMADHREASYGEGLYCDMQEREEADFQDYVSRI